MTMQEKKREEESTTIRRNTEGQYDELLEADNVNKEVYQLLMNGEKQVIDHGTNLASLVGASSNNAFGTAGTCLGRCHVMCLRAIEQLEAEEFDRVSDDLERNEVRTKESELRVIRALRYAYQMGSRISTNSYGRKGMPFRELEQEIERLNKLDEKGILFVAAAGNEGKNLDGNQNKGENERVLENDQIVDNSNLFQPAAMPSTSGVLVVGASNRDGQRLPFSNYGNNTVSLFAPGILIAAGTSGENKVGS